MAKRGLAAAIILLAGLAGGAAANAGPAGTGPNAGKLPAVPAISGGSETVPNEFPWGPMPWHPFGK